jgi:hypothetical protein
MVFNCRKACREARSNAVGDCEFGIETYTGWERGRSCRTFINF